MTPSDRPAPALGALARGRHAGAGRAASCQRGPGEAGRAAYPGRPWAGGPQHLALPRAPGWVLGCAPPGAAVAASLAPAARPRWAAWAPAGGGRPPWPRLQLPPSLRAMPAP